MFNDLSAKFKTDPKYREHKEHLHRMLSVDWFDLKWTVLYTLGLGNTSHTDKEGIEAASYIIQVFKGCDHPDKALRHDEEVRVLYFIEWLSIKGYGCFLNWIPWAIDSKLLHEDFRKLYVNELYVNGTGGNTKPNLLSTNSRDSTDTDENPVKGIGKRTYLRVINSLLENQGIDISNSKTDRHIKDLLQAKPETISRLLSDLRNQKLKDNDTKGE